MHKGGPKDEHELQQIRDNLGWTEPPFSVPEDVRAVFAQQRAMGDERLRRVLYRYLGLLTHGPRSVCTLCGPIVGVWCSVGVAGVLNLLGPKSRC